jgi:hypothetical protein
MRTWRVYSDENDSLGVVVAEDAYTAQDKAQALTNNAIGVWIEETSPEGM